MPTFGSLFAGIGGIDLGLERAGWTGRWQVEYEPFCQRVLAKHWPDVTRYGDIKSVDWSGVERVDLVAGGFPCQPVSFAGRRQIQDDDRWLWPEFARCLRELRPRYVLVENVPGLLVGGGMDDVLGGLAELGYDTEWESIPASAVGAPHLRYRVWIVATYADRQGEPGQPVDAGARSRVLVPSGGRDVAHANRVGPGREAEVGQARLAGIRQGEASAEPHGPSLGTMADPDGERWERSGRARDGRSGLADRGVTLANPAGIRPSRSREHEQPVHPSQLGNGGWWATEPDVGRVAHGVPARVDRLRALGNAVVPQVVEWIGRRILEAEALT